MRLAAAIAILGLLAARPVPAQLPAVRGYLLNVPLWTDSTAFAVGGLSDLNRLRLMGRPSLGPLRLEVAYEHVVTYSQRQGLGGGELSGVIVPTGGEWMDLLWTLEDSEHWNWTHRFDRMGVAWSPIGLIDITVGRQTISWATTLFLTPADPFVPFDPSDPFREYRAGVDAVRVQAYPGVFTDIDFVVRPSEFQGLAGDDETLTVAARGRTVWKGWELSAWAGALHDDPAAAVGTAGSIAGTAIRGELSFREPEGELALRAALGLDRRVTVLDRDLYFVVEYQHDDFGASRPGELVTVIGSKPYLRGEMQVLGRDVAMGQAAYQLHPLLAADLLLLVNVNDTSALLAPGLSYSASNELTFRAGAFLGLGDGTADLGSGLPSEFGIVPTIVYASASAFF